MDTWEAFMFYKLDPTLSENDIKLLVQSSSEINTTPRE